MDRGIKAVAAATVALSLATSAPAATPGDKCEVQKIKLTGVYAACRLRAEAKARLKGLEPDHTICAQKLAAKWQQTEGKAGPGVCPTEGDQDEIAEVVDDSTTEVVEQLAGPDPDCPPGLLDRTPSQVVTDTIAALNAADGDLLRCNYHPDAFLIADQGLFIGPADIADYLLQFPQLFEAPIVVTEDNPFRDTVRILYGIDGGWIVVEDGSDTFEVRRGRIRRQAQHALITFTGPPPG